jgi:hypothetical protein
MERPRHLTIIVSLAFVQGFMVTLVALIWFGIASVFSPDSGTTGTRWPLLVMMAEAKGGLLVVLALLYLVFVVGAWGMRDWAWWVGLLASVLSILYVVRAVLGGGSIVIGVFVLIIPFIIIWYLLSPTGKQIFVR